MNKLNKKFNTNNISNLEDLKFFVKNGFVVYEHIFDKKNINNIKNLLKKKYQELIKNKKINSYEISTKISKFFESTKEEKQMYNSKKLIQILSRYLGTDIARLNGRCAYINDPVNKKFSTKLNDHVDAWTGNSANTLILISFLTEANKYNSIRVYPSSHLLGKIPTINRRYDNKVKLDVKSYTFDHLKAGDLVLLHSLLLHGSINSKNKKTNLRMSLNERFFSLGSKLSSQEASMGYKTLSLGPLNHITRIIGNDDLAPFRVLNGPKGISESLKDIYKLVDY